MFRASAACASCAYFYPLRRGIIESEAVNLDGGNTVPDRTARRLIGELLSQGLLLSDSPKGLLRLGLPLHAVAYYFPRLFPEGIEETLLASAPPALFTTPRTSARRVSTAAARKKVGRSPRQRR